MTPLSPADTSTTEDHFHFGPATSFFPVILVIALCPSLVAQKAKYSSTMLETWVWSQDQEDPLEEEVATHFSNLAWRIPWTGELMGTVDGVTNSQTRLSNEHFPRSMLDIFWPWGLIFWCYKFALSYCSWGCRGKNTGVVCHCLLQWTTFCENSPLWPVHLRWPCMACLIASLS